MIEFFFDCSSPYTYLGFRGVQKVAKDTGAEIRWRPVLVGGIFNEINPSVYASREHPVPAKQNYMVKDLQDWAAYYGVKIIMPPDIFPVSSVKVMRACIAVEPQGKLVEFAEAAFQSYWSRNEDISDDGVVEALCWETGVDPEWLQAEVSSDAIKLQLRENTKEVVARGGFGSPMIFVNETDMYFGNDRLHFVQTALEK